MFIIALKIVAYTCVSIILMAGMYHFSTTKIRSLMAVIAGYAYSMHLATVIYQSTNSSVVAIIAAMIVVIPMNRTVKVLFA